MARPKQKIGEMLVEDGLISEAQLQTGLVLQRTSGGLLGEILIGIGAVTEEQFQKVLARQLEFPFRTQDELLSTVIPPEVLGKLPEQVALEHLVLPVNLDTRIGLLGVVAPSPLDSDAVEEVKRLSGATHVGVGLATRRALFKAVKFHYRRLAMADPGDTEQEQAIDPEAVEEEPVDLDTLVAGTCHKCGFPYDPKEAVCENCEAILHAGTDPLIGKEIQDYALVRKLGEGGMGMVYEGRDKRSGKTIAIKILRVHLSSDQSAIKRFYREAKAQSALKHENVVEVQDFGFHEGIGFFITMEFLKGQSFKDLLASRSGLLTASRLYDIFAPVCDAMEHAHHEGVVHRDLKPDNIFLADEDGKEMVKVLDFGVAKLVRSRTDESNLTMSGMALGTPRYMSPEQANEGEVDERSDIYSLAVVLFEALTGRPLFEGSSAYQVMLRHVYTSAPTLSKVRPDIKFPKDLIQLLEESLSKKQEERPRSMGEFKRRFLEALQEKDALTVASPAVRGATPAEVEKVSSKEKPISLWDDDDEEEDKKDAPGLTPSSMAGDLFTEVLAKPVPSLFDELGGEKKEPPAAQPGGKPTPLLRQAGKAQGAGAGGSPPLRSGGIAPLAVGTHSRHRRQTARSVAESEPVGLPQKQPEIRPSRKGIVPRAIKKQRRSLRWPLAVVALLTLFGGGGWLAYQQWGEQLKVLLDDGPSRKRGAAAWTALGGELSEAMLTVAKAVRRRRRRERWRRRARRRRAAARRRKPGPKARSRRARARRRKRRIRPPKKGRGTGSRRGARRKRTSKWRWKWDPKLRKFRPVRRR